MKKKTFIITLLLAMLTVFGCLFSGCGSDEYLYDYEHGTRYEVGKYKIDELEPNNSATTANTITQNGTTVDGALNKYPDIDFFKIVLGPNETVISIITFTYAADLKGSYLALMDSTDSDLVALGSLDSSKETKTLRYTNPTSSPQIYYLEIFFDSDYTYKNTTADYLMYVAFE